MFMQILECAPLSKLWISFWKFKIFYPFINECICMLASLCQLMCIFFDHP